MIYRNLDLVKAFDCTEFAAKEKFFFSGQSTKREEGVRVCPVSSKEKRTFFTIFFFKFVAVLLTTKPRVGGGG